MEGVFPAMTQPQREVLRETLARVAEALKPEAIICYGCRQVSREGWSAFEPASTRHTVSQYDVLIVTRPEEKYNDHEVWDKLQRFNGEAIRLIAVVHPLRAVQEAIQKGSRFFITVCRQGVLVYGEAKPEVGLETVPAIPGDQTRWAHHFGLAHQFLSGAEHYLLNAQPSLAVFMLHQATEHACIALIYACLGYRSTTHNLSRLLALTENIGVGLSDLFPRHTEVEKELFSLLVRAYGGVRYRQSFTICLEDATMLVARVKELVRVTERIYNEFQKERGADGITGVRQF